MNKRNELIWSIFGLLTVCSLGGVGWALHVFNLTPMLIHDSLHRVGQLNDAQRDALYLAILNAYRPIVFGGAAILLAWFLFTLLALRLVRRPASDLSPEKLDA